MSAVRAAIDGESFITLRAAAACYECDTHWVFDVYEFGFLGEGLEIDGELAVASQMLDRLAEIRRLNVFQGLELSVIATFIDADG